VNSDFSNLKILVIGDLMIDHYFFGHSNRLSPEAPVPVILPNQEYFVPGGAANVVMNLCSMGADVTCVGIVGDDIWGKELLALFKNQNINTDNIVTIKNHTTTCKQRVYLDEKQFVRIDKEIYKNLELNKLDIDFSNFDVCIFSDYNKGVIETININHQLIIVDPKKDDFSMYKNCNIITPNFNELQRASSINIKDNKSIIEACNKLIEENNFKYIVVKNGDKGMIIVGSGNYVKKIKPHYVKNPDVTGAGDTVLSILSLVYAKTGDIEMAANVANYAASIVVSKPGTAKVTINDINNYIKK
jgi:rfaE bifunctional protein kinase chain/domain